jgi:quercetin dioxygenase-like cupin family protein
VAGPPTKEQRVLRDPRPVIENPISGERIVIRTSGAETGGRLLCFDLFLPPGGHVPAGHVHPEQVERFTVLAGQLRFRIGRRTVIASPGETIAVPAGTAHWFGNPGTEVAQARVEVEPALRTQELFEATEAMARAGHIPGTRLPRLTDLVLVLIEFSHELAVPYMPAAVARALLTTLAWLSRLAHDLPSTRGNLLEELLLMSARTTWKPHTRHGELDTQDRESLPDSVYAFPKQRKEPLTDASHVQNALARFDQVKDVSDADRDVAFANIKKAARHFGVEVEEGSWHDLGKRPHTRNPVHK